MALLTRRQTLCWISAAALLGSCEASESLGHADVWVSDCEDLADCGLNRPSEHFAVQAFFDPSVSRYAPHGLYAYMELPRSDGARGVLELDVPTDAPSDAPLSDYQVSYREQTKERLHFEAREVRGQIVLPRIFVSDDAGSCGCDEGVFTLQLADADGHARALSLGHLSRSEEMCLGGLRATDDEGLRVRVQGCTTTAAPPVSSGTSPPEPPPSRPVTSSSSPHYHDDRYDTVDSYTTVETGCGGSSYEDGSDGCGGSSDADSSGGCGSSSDTESSGGSGCGDHDSEDSSSHSGCEGDTSDQPSACTVARRGGSPFMATGLPILLVCLWQVLRTARMRKR